MVCWCALSQFSKQQKICCVFKCESRCVFLEMRGTADMIKWTNTVVDVESEESRMIETYIHWFVFDERFSHKSVPEKVIKTLFKKVWKQKEIFHKPKQIDGIPCLSDKETWIYQGQCCTWLCSVHKYQSLFCCPMMWTSQQNTFGNATDLIFLSKLAEMACWSPSLDEIVPQNKTRHHTEWLVSPFPMLFATDWWTLSWRLQVIWRRFPQFLLFPWQSFHESLYSIEWKSKHNVRTLKNKSQTLCFDLNVYEPHPN